MTISKFEAQCLARSACFFTGHRKLTAGDADWLPRKLADAIADDAAAGVTLFIAGGAMGFDTLAAETVLRLRADGKIPADVKLFIALPCPPDKQSEKFILSDKIRYDDVLERADGVCLLCDTRTKDCMLSRDRFMVDQAARGIAFLRPNLAGKRGGTNYTVRYAKDNGKIITYLFDEPFALPYRIRYIRYNTI